MKKRTSQISMKKRPSQISMKKSGRISQISLQKSLENKNRMSFKKMPEKTTGNHPKVQLQQLQQMQQQQQDPTLHSPKLQQLNKNIQKLTQVLYSLRGHNESSQQQFPFSILSSQQFNSLARKKSIKNNQKLFQQLMNQQQQQFQTSQAKIPHLINIGSQQVQINEVSENQTNDNNTTFTSYQDMSDSYISQTENQNYENINFDLDAMNPYQYYNPQSNVKEVLSKFDCLRTFQTQTTRRRRHTMLLKRKLSMKNQF